MEDLPCLELVYLKNYIIDCSIQSQHSPIGIQMEFFT